MRHVDPQKDEFGKKLLNLMTEYGYSNFLLAGVNDNTQSGMCMTQTPDINKAMTCITLLLVAENELFEFVDRLKMSAYIEQVAKALAASRGDGSPTPAGDEFTAKGKLH